MPDPQTVVAFRQTVDFYLWKGIPCARKWPKWHYPAATAAELNTQRAFSAAAKITGMMSPRLQLAWREMVNPGRGWSWVDMFRAAARGKGWMRVV